MSVDKFGRHVESVRKVVRGPPGEGFSVTSEGNYDVKNKRLVNLGNPEAVLDAVSVRYLVQRSLVTSRAADLNFDANKMLIRNVGTPKLPGDAANVEYINNHALTKDSDGYFNAKKKIIRNLKPPTALNDAVTLEYLENAVIPKTTDGNYNVNNKLLRNVSDPVLSNDVVTKGYIENLIPVKSDEHWGFGDKRLSNIIDPLYEGEAVNLRTLKRETKSVITYDKKSKTFKHDNQEIKIVTEDSNRPLIYLDTRSKTGLRISGSNRTFHMHYTPYLYADHLIDVHGNRIMWDEKNQRMYVKHDETINYWGDLSLLGDGDILQAKAPQISTTLHVDSSKEGEKDNQFIHYEKGSWNAMKRKITNISSGEADSDAAVIGQVMKYNNSSWNAKKMKISNVEKGTDDNDVAVVSQLLKPDSVLQKNNSNWDAKNKKITSVAKGTEDSDVAIVSQLPTDYMKSINSSWDAVSRRISNVKEGAQPNDVLTFNQALKPSINKGEFYTTSDTTYTFMQPITYKLHGEQLTTGKIVSKREVWDAREMPIRDIAPGYYDTDACRYDQALVCEYLSGKYYDAKGKPICNIKKGSAPGEAIVFEQALRIENNELYLGNTKLELYFNDTNGDQVRVFFKRKV